MMYLLHKLCKVTRKRIPQMEPLLLSWALQHPGVVWEPRPRASPHSTGSLEAQESRVPRTKTLSSCSVKTSYFPVCEAKGGRKQALRKKELLSTCRLMRAGSPRHSWEKLELLSGQFPLILSGIVLCYKRILLKVRDVETKRQNKSSL